MASGTYTIPCRVKKRLQTLNLGKLADCPLPRRLDIALPNTALNTEGFRFTLIDLRGINTTDPRPDLHQALIKLPQVGISRPASGGCNIYALVDPRAPTIWRYIGRSFHPLSRRGRHVGDCRHLKAGCTAKEKWIAGLLSEGFQPCVILLETGISASQANARENAWIEHALRKRDPLTNAVLFRRMQLSPLALRRH